jgi:hypothetical protein
MIHRERLLAIVPLMLIVGVAITAPHQLGVLLYKLALVTLAAVAGYWIDRAVTPYARPDRCDHAAQAGVRRAIIVAATMIAVGIGL